MRCLILAATLVALPALPCLAQDSAAVRDSVQRDARSRVIARAALEIYNAQATLRSMGPYTVAAGDTVGGDLAVVDGPLLVAGAVHGRVVAINADVTLRDGARIGGDLIVIGGALAGRDVAVIDGAVRLDERRLAYRESGDELVAVGDTTLTAGLEEWLRRWRARRERSGTRFLITTAKTYNRVEGLPVLAGPSFRGRYDWGEVAADALGVLRTANDVRWDAENLGHKLSGEVRLGGGGGRGRGTMIGGQLYDLVRPVEDWHLDDAEVGLAAFFLHRDFRDHFGVHGGALSAGVFTGADAEIRVGLRDERWASRSARDVFSVFRNADPWRANPAADEGRFHVATAQLRVDSRNRIDRPWSGWYVVADYEHGRGRVTSFAPLSPGVRDAPDSAVTYGRAFLDLRRYNRVSPTAQLNLRAVLGGWLHGDPLPAQRRLSVGGVSTLPGYDFRATVGSADLNQCGTEARAAGTPAECDRVLLLQAEYRGDVRINPLGLFDGWGDSRWRHDAEWVVFVNSGRGWLMGDAPPGGVGRARYVGRGELPGLGSLRTDIGAGLDLGLFGVYVAKALSEPGQRTNFYVRLRERF